jgi:DHA1 family tetracycline resistance protein-like MFS transporter
MKNRALAFIFCTVMLDALAFGVMINVLPPIVLRFLEGDTASAAEMLALFATLWGMMQFLCSPLMGVLSDRYGRRPVILLSCLGLGIDYVFMAIAPSMTWLFVGRIVSGMTASTISTARAYVADVVPAEERPKVFGFLGMAFGLGFVMGPAIGGLLAGFDPRLPFWVSAGACMVNALFGWFALPESLPPQRRTAFSWKRANPIGSLNLLLSHRQLTSLAAIHFLIAIVQQALPSVFVLYTGHRYGWHEATVGVTLAIAAGSTALVQGFLTGPAVGWLGAHRVMICGLLFGALGLLIYAVAPSSLWFWLGVPAVALWSVSGPALQGMMTRHVRATEQGQLQGANNSARSLAIMIGPGLFAGSFAYLMGPLPGAPFLLAAMLLLVAVGVAWMTVSPAPAEGRA